MSKTRLPRFFCWTKMGHEAGQPLQAIISRKEAERRRGSGVFFWGIGTALGQRIWAFIEQTQKPVVVFSPMKSKARQIDITPQDVFFWTAYMDKNGSKHPLPNHAIVLSRGNLLTGTKKHHYALVCRKETPLLHETWPAIEWDALWNFYGNSRLGYSQVTAIVECKNSLKPSRTQYEILFSAELVPPYYIKLVDPVTVSNCELIEMKAQSKRLHGRPLLKMQ